MDKEKLMNILEAVEGLKRYEWDKIVHVINRKYDAKSNKIVLTDSASLKESYELEYGSLSNNLDK